nr:MAG TPA: hypothetical protein [Caudoviricetes sp.]
MLKNVELWSMIKTDYILWGNSVWLKMLLET